MIVYVPVIWMQIDNLWSIIFICIPLIIKSVSVIWKEKE